MKKYRAFIWVIHILHSVIYSCLFTWLGRKGFEWEMGFLDMGDKYISSQYFVYLLTLSTICRNRRSPSNDCKGSEERRSVSKERAKSVDKRSPSPDRRSRSKSNDAQQKDG